MVNTEHFQIKSDCFCLVNLKVPKCQNMKKYTRLLLIITTLISLFLFLIYRQQYNRLHYVLEVFDFFGQPCNFSNLEKNDKILDHHDWGPLPLWQESEKIYLYSAFWTNQNEVKAIAVVPTDSFQVRNCFLWYDNKRRPILGKFRFSMMSQDTIRSVKMLFYYCGSRSDNIDDVPYAVSFSAKNKLMDPKKVLLTNNLSYRVSLNVTICVPPTPFNKTKFVEFLSFHRLIGVNSFIFYGGSIPHKISKLISNLAYSLDIYVSFFPWNFPYSYKEMSKEIVTFDCILRNRNQSYYAAVLEIDEYTVPEHYNSLNEVLNNIEHDSQKVSFPVIKFCLQQAKPDQPIALQNLEVMNTKELTVANIYRVNVQNKTVSVQNYDRGSAAIHKYVHCTDKPIKRSINTSILKYSTDFIRTTLFQMLQNNAL